MTQQLSLGVFCRASHHVILVKREWVTNCVVKSSGFLVVFVFLFTAILKLRQYVDLPTLKTVYFSLIYSHLQYCISSWGLAHANAHSPLEKLHKRIIRNITNSSYLEHTTPLFFKLNLLKIHDICNLEIAKNMFQIKNKMTLHDSQIFCLATQMHEHHTRLSSKNNYFIPRKRTDFGKKSFSFVGPKVWQNVPNELKVLNFSQFKRKLKFHFISKYTLD